MDTNLNNVVLTGVLERDPITRFADHGTQQVHFTLRVEEAGPAGQLFKRFVSCEAYGQAWEEGERDRELMLLQSLVHALQRATSTWQ